MAKDVITDIEQVGEAGEEEELRLTASRPDLASAVDDAEKSAVDVLDCAVWGEGKLRESSDTHLSQGKLRHRERESSDTHLSQGKLRHRGESSDTHLSQQGKAQTPTFLRESSDTAIDTCAGAAVRRRGRTRR